MGDACRRHFHVARRVHRPVEDDRTAARCAHHSFRTLSDSQCELSERRCVTFPYCDSIGRHLRLGGRTALADKAHGETGRVSRAAIDHPLREAQRCPYPSDSTSGILVIGEESGVVSRIIEEDLHFETKEVAPGQIAEGHPRGRRPRRDRLLPRRQSRPRSRRATSAACGCRSSCSRREDETLSAPIPESLGGVVIADVETRDFYKKRLWRRVGRYPAACSRRSSAR